MTGRWHIRPSRPDEIEQLAQIWHLAVRSSHPFLCAEKLREESHLLRDLYLQKIPTWVALHDGQLAGFVSAIDGFLSGIFIAPGHQGQGLGRYLVEFALKPDQPARVEVMARNRSGLGFYQRLGFRPTSFRVHDTLGHCLVEMTRPASAADHIPA